MPAREVQATLRTEGLSGIEQLWPFKPSDQLTIHSAPKEEGVAALTTDTEIQEGFVIVGGEGRLGAPKAATNGRLAIPPPMARAVAFRMTPGRCAVRRLGSHLRSSHQAKCRRWIGAGFGATKWDPDQAVRAGIMFGTMSSAGRRMVVCGGLVLVALGAVVSLRPFRITIALPATGGVAAGTGVRANCKAPVVGAWETGSKGQLALWATSYGITDTGYEVRSGQGPYCANSARLRLAGGGAGIAAGAIIIVLCLKRRGPFDAISGA